MAVCYLKNLQILNLSNNLIETFPKNLSPKCFPSLQQINLNHNKIKDIPSILRFFNHLHTILISNNQLQNIQEISKNDFPSLKFLDISSNQIVEILNEFSVHFSKLEVLNISNNKIENLPLNLGLLENLKNLDISGNPILNINQELIMKCSSSLIEFLKSCSEEFLPKKKNS